MLLIDPERHAVLGALLHEVSKLMGDYSLASNLYKLRRPNRCSPTHRRRGVFSQLAAQAVMARFCSVWSEADGWTNHRERLADVSAPIGLALTMNEGLIVLDRNEPSGLRLFYLHPRDGKAVMVGEVAGDPFHTLLLPRGVTDVYCWHLQTIRRRDSRHLASDRDGKIKLVDRYVVPGRLVGDVVEDDMGVRFTVLRETIYRRRANFGTRLSAREITTIGFSNLRRSVWA